MWTAAAMSREANCSYNQCFAFAFRGPVARRVPAHRARSGRGPARRACAPSSLRTARARRSRPPFSVEMPLARPVDPRSRGARARDRAPAATRVRDAVRPGRGPAAPRVRRARVRGAPPFRPHRASHRVRRLVVGGAVLGPRAALRGRLRRHPGAARRPRRRTRTTSPTRRATTEVARGRGGRGATGPRSIQTERRCSTCRSPERARREDLPQRPRGTADRRGAVRRDQADRGAIRRARSSQRCLPRTRCSCTACPASRTSSWAFPSPGSPSSRTPTLVAHCVNTVALASRARPGRPLRRAPSHASVTSSPRPRTTRASPSAASCAGCSFPATRAARRSWTMMFSIDKVGAPFDFGDVTHRVARHAEVVLQLRAAGERRRQRLGHGRRVRLQRGSLRRAHDRRWLSHYETLLRGDRGPARMTPSRRLPLLNGGQADDPRRVERHERWPSPRRSGCTACSRPRSAGRPDAEAVVDGDERLSYRELNRRANRLGSPSAALRGRRRSVCRVCAWSARRISSSRCWPSRRRAVRMSPRSRPTRQIASPSCWRTRGRRVVVTQADLAPDVSGAGAQLVSMDRGRATSAAREP